MDQREQVKLYILNKYLLKFYLKTNTYIIRLVFLLKQAQIKSKKLSMKNLIKEEEENLDLDQVLKWLSLLMI